MRFALLRVPSVLRAVSVLKKTLKRTVPGGRVWPRSVAETPGHHKGFAAQATLVQLQQQALSASHRMGMCGKPAGDGRKEQNFAMREAWHITLSKGKRGEAQGNRAQRVCAAAARERAACRPAGAGQFCIADHRNRCGMQRFWLSLKWPRSCQHYQSIRVHLRQARFVPPAARTARNDSAGNRGPRTEATIAADARGYRVPARLMAASCLDDCAGVAIEATIWLRPCPRCV